MKAERGGRKVATTGKLDATDTTMCSSAAKKSSVMSKYEFCYSVDVSQGEDES